MLPSCVHPVVVRIARGRPPIAQHQCLVVLAVQAVQAVLESLVRRAIQRALVVQLVLDSACLVDGAPLEEREVVVVLEAC